MITKSRSTLLPERFNKLSWRESDEFIPIRIVRQTCEKPRAAMVIRRRHSRWETSRDQPAELLASHELAQAIRQETKSEDEIVVSQPLAVTNPAPTETRILIADDDALVRGSLAAVLEYEGFVVDEAGDGAEAVTRASARTPHLVLLDLNMPGMDGWQAFSKLDHVQPLVPVIVITARPNQYPEAKRLGVDAFMEKPLNIPTLVRAIRGLTGESENRHLRRITNPEFVTRFLDGSSE